MVFHKNIGPLISTDEMTRCIHCTRCVRFGQEIAGVMELGMIGRGEHSEIMSFRRPLGRFRTVGQHDRPVPGGRAHQQAVPLQRAHLGTGAPQVGRARTTAWAPTWWCRSRANQVMRVLPLENEAVNECWLSDRDRFSYEGLNSDERLTSADAAGRTASGTRSTGRRRSTTRRTRSASGARPSTARNALGALGSRRTQHAGGTVPAGQLMRGLDCDNVDFRLRQSTSRPIGQRAGAPWLGMTIAEVGASTACWWSVRSCARTTRCFASRVRQAVKRGASRSIVHAADDDLLMPLAHKAIVAPREWPRLLARCWSPRCRRR